MSSKVLEIEEKTIDGAIEKACRDFGVAREKLNIEIISEGSGGFLGLMAKKAKIRASLMDFDMDFTMESPAPKKPEQHEPRRPSVQETIPPPKRPEAVRPTKPSQPTQPQAQRQPAPVQTVEVAPPEPKPPVRPDDRPKPVLAAAVPAIAATTPFAIQACDLLNTMLEKMTFTCQVVATETDDTIILSITGDESGLLIGRRGQNLDALQYIINKSVNRSENGRKMIIVDSEGYRQRREESLLVMAERIREKVKKTNKPLSLAHMNAHDRRIIHLALQEDEELVTKSRGEGEYRKVIVLPARKPQANGQARTRNRQ